MQRYHGLSKWRHFNAKNVKWAQLMTRWQPIVRHDNPLKQGKCETSNPKCVVMCGKTLWLGVEMNTNRSCVGSSDFI